MKINNYDRALTAFQMGLLKPVLTPDFYETCEVISAVYGKGIVFDVRHHVGVVYEIGTPRETVRFYQPCGRRYPFDHAPEIVLANGTPETMFRLHSKVMIDVVHSAGSCAVTGVVVAETANQVKLAIFIENMRADICHMRPAFSVVVDKHTILRYTEIE
jgi:hypothetical protein